MGPFYQAIQFSRERAIAAKKKGTKPVVRTGAQFLHCARRLKLLQRAILTVMTTHVNQEGSPPGIPHLGDFFE